MAILQEKVLILLNRSAASLAAIILNFDLLNKKIDLNDLINEILKHKNKAMLELSEIISIQYTIPLSQELICNQQK